VRKIYKIFGRKHGGRGQSEDLPYISVDNVIVDLREVGWEAVDWLHLAQDMD
jgi:hypothetical protein